MHGGDFKREVEKEANYRQYRKESFCSFRNYVSNGIAKAERNEDWNPHLNEVKNLALHFLCIPRFSYALLFDPVIGVALKRRVLDQNLGPKEGS